jgi:hypothetical protein
MFEPLTGEWLAGANNLVYKEVPKDLFTLFASPVRLYSLVSLGGLC